MSRPLPRAMKEDVSRFGRQRELVGAALDPQQLAVAVEADEELLLALAEPVVDAGDEDADHVGHHDGGHQVPMKVAESPPVAEAYISDMGRAPTPRPPAMMGAAMKRMPSMNPKPVSGGDAARPERTWR